MVKIEQKENTLAAIELVVKEFLSEDALGKWFSVKERSLGNIMRQVNLDYRYSSAIYNELKNIGMIEKEGENIQLRYKINTTFIPDIKATAERIWERYHQNNSKSAVFESRRGDCNPPRNKKLTTMEDFERRDCRKRKTQIKKELARVPRLGEIVYALVNGFITEAKITCVRFNEEDKVLVSFTTPIITQLEDGQPTNVKKTDWCLRSIAFSVDELIKKLQSNIQKFDNKRK